MPTVLSITNQPKLSCRPIYIRSMASIICREYGRAVARKHRRRVQQVFLSTASCTLRSLQKDQSALRELLYTYQDDASFVQRVEDVAHAIVNARSVSITGIGKSGYVGRRMAASLSSVGVKAHFVHGTEWVHGDLGALRSGDAVVAISHSGKTAELVHLASLTKAKDVVFCSMVGFLNSPLDDFADFTVFAPASEEILGSVPSRSIVAQEAIVNAIVSNIVDIAEFEKADFLKNHPGGSIGSLAK
jgi:D-arabinose 5-phosphate isomerase GutQ